MTAAKVLGPAAPPPLAAGTNKPEQAGFRQGEATLGRPALAVDVEACLASTSRNHFRQRHIRCLTRDDSILL